MKPHLLDLYCCSGGAARGYQQAGFHVTGVDIVDRPNYCGDAFVKADAVEFLREHGHRFVAVHASPPCQAGTGLTLGTNAARNTETGRSHARLIQPTREALTELDIPYVIENVQSWTKVGAELGVRPDLMLCGEMFGLGVIRHRWFELGGWWMFSPPHNPHRGYVTGWRHGVYKEGPYLACYGNGGDKGTVPQRQAAMGIDWTDDPVELAEAIPPDYSRLIGEELMNALGMEDAA